MTRFAYVVALLMGIGSLTFAFGGAGFDQVARGLILFGMLWLVAGWNRWVWFSTIGIILSLALAAFGLWIALPPGWMISGALGGLLAWDLTDFMRRLRFAPLSADLRELQLRHLTRLTIVTLIGLFLASVAMLVRLEFTFEWVVLLTVIAALGITQLVAWLRRS